MEKETLIVVANGSYARFFLSKGGGALQQVKELRHQDEGWKEKMANHQGPTPVNVAGHAKHNADAHASPTQKGRLAFAKTIASYLKEAHNGGSYQRLYLVASPAFLGELRQSLPGPLLALIGGEVSKDLTAHEPTKVRGYLPPVL